VRSFEQALEALSHLPESRHTLEQAIDLRLALRTALFPSRDLERILVSLHEAESLALALDDPRRLGQVTVFLASQFIRLGMYDQAITAGQRAVALATAAGDVLLQALAKEYLGQTYMNQGDYHQGIDCLGQAVTFFDGAPGHERFGQLTMPGVFSRYILARCHAELGTFAEGHARAEEGLRIAEATPDPASLIFAAWGIGVVALRQGDLPRALPRLERAMAICQDADLLTNFPGLAVDLGAAYTLGGRVTDAVPLLAQVLEQRAAMNAGAPDPLCRLSLGEAQLLAGRLEEAHALAEQALALADAHQKRGYQAYALRLLGDIAARREPPEWDLAEAYYRQALALAEEVGMRRLQAHCHRGLGTLYTQVVRPAQARAELSTAIGLYRAMDMMFWLPDAEAALAGVAGPGWREV
jgi:tetratricopeptide (TPR) repeat protein